LVGDPELVGVVVVDPVRGAEEVARLVLVAVLDLVVEELDAGAKGKDLALAGEVELLRRREARAYGVRRTRPAAMGSLTLVMWQLSARGWKMGWTKAPSIAAMQTRPCFSSISRYRTS